MGVTGRVAALVPAAGSGERLGPGQAKAFRPVGGVPMVVRASQSLASCPSVDLIVVAAPVNAVDAMAACFADHHVDADVSFVAGGRTRQESVALALAAMPDDVDVILVHDAARPLVPVEVVTAVVTAIQGGQSAVVPVLPVVDTIRTVDEGGNITGSIPRDSLRAAQTPQGFRREILERAHEQAQGPATDDVALVEALGIAVYGLPGHEDAFKITRPLDALLAEAVVARRASHTRRDRE